MKQKDYLIQNEQLKSIIIDTIWMARRYANGRSTYTPRDVNLALDKCKELGIKIDPDISIGDYANDGMMGKWDSEQKGFRK